MTQSKRFICFWCQELLIFCAKVEKGQQLSYLKNCAFIFPWDKYISPLCATSRVKQDFETYRYCRNHNTERIGKMFDLSLPVEATERNLLTIDASTNRPRLCLTLTSGADSDRRLSIDITCGFMLNYERKYSPRRVRMKAQLVFKWR